MNICLEAVEGSNKFERNNFEDNSIKKMYIKKNIDRNDIKHNDIVRWNDFAKKHNLKTTIGSDFHKKDGIHPIIGLVGEDISLTENEVNQMIDFLLHN